MDVSVSSAIGGWPAGRLIDGATDEAWSSLAHSEHLASGEWAAVVLPVNAQIDAVRIHPRPNTRDPAHADGFPKDFVVQYAYREVDGGGVETRTCDPSSPLFREARNWKALVSRYGFDQPSTDAVEFTFSPRQAQCVRVLGTELSQDGFGIRYMQLSEIELRNGGNRVDPPGVEAVASSTISGWPVARLVDGRTDEAWSSLAHSEHLASGEWAAVVLPANTQIDAVRVHPRPNTRDRAHADGFPKDFVVQYALREVDGGGVETRTCDLSSPLFREARNWKALVSRYGFDQPSTDAVDFTFSPRQAQCVRVLGTELSQDGFGIRYMQLSEIELRNGGARVGPPGVEAVASSTISGWPATRLVDGGTDEAWSSLAHSEHLASGEWAAVVLPASAHIDAVKIHPRPNTRDPAHADGFPKDFVVQYAYRQVDGGGVETRTCDPSSPLFREARNWKALVSRYEFDQPSTDAVEFAFMPREAGCVRVLGTELSQDGFGIRYMQLSEIQSLEAAP